MTAFVEECRLEWKRLGVPDLLADEMASELESDLAEAEADGVSTAEMLGESDPRRFAATWATERGLVTEPTRKKSRRRRWIWVVVGLALAFVFMATLGALAATKVSVQSHVGSPPGRVQQVPVGPPARLVRVPDLVGLKLCQAYRIAAARHFDLGFRLTPKTMSDCRGSFVIHQRPTAHALVPRHWRMSLRTRLAPVRVPNLVGRSEGAAENILDPLGLHVRYYSNLKVQRRLRLQDRRVVSQIPAAGTLVQPPHAVTVRLRGTKS